MGTTYLMILIIVAFAIFFYRGTIFRMLRKP